MKDFILMQTGVTLFFKNKEERPDKFILGIESKMENIFSNVPNITSVPEGENFDDFPIVRLESDTTPYSAIISRKKATLIRAGEGSQKFDDIKDKHNQIGKDFFQHILSNAVISRVGITTEFFVKDTESKLTISKQIGKEIKGIHKGVLQEARLHYGVRSQFENLQLNNVSVIRPVEAEIVDGDIAVKNIGVGILRDLNTIPEVDYSAVFNIETFVKFFEHSNSLLDTDALEKVLWPKG